MCRKSLLFAAAVLIALSMSAGMHAQQSTTHAASTSTKFGPVPGLPGCAAAAPRQGDPAKEAFVVLAKVTAGCKIPWHWHTGNERLMIVSGRAKVETKEATSNMAAGDYINLPAKHQHQFTCLAACRFFIESDRAFDIHYVDKDGKEIPQEQALKGAGHVAKH